MKLFCVTGPPGTGKTTLCKAIAQKLTIRMSRNYTSAQFIEINSHSLFSKWFSEVKINEIYCNQSCELLFLFMRCETFILRVEN